MHKTDCIVDANIAVLTLFGYTNYGNRLQNYATQIVLQECGYFVQSVVTPEQKSETGHENESKNPTTGQDKNICKALFRVCKRIYHAAWNIYSSRRVAERIERFHEFTAHNINEYDCPDANILFTSEFNERYSYFVTGSDQVWSPYYGSAEPDSVFFLPFANKEKRVAMSVSFGIAYDQFFHLQPNLIASYKRYISEFFLLSVREEEGARIIKCLTGREVPVIIDPTMLLKKEKWKELSTRPEFYSFRLQQGENYIFTYFLGKVKPEFKQRIKEFQQRYNLNIIAVNNLHDHETYLTDPAEFVYLVDHASLICTDSFHGIVFSILFEKPFVAFERTGGEHMGSRFNTLFNKFGITKRTWNTVVESDVLKMDYIDINKRLQFERVKAWEFLSAIRNSASIDRHIAEGELDDDLSMVEALN